MFSRYPKQFGRKEEYVLGVVESEVEWAPIDGQKMANFCRKLRNPVEWLIQIVERLEYIAVRRVRWQKLGDYTALTREVLYAPP